MFDTRPAVAHAFLSTLHTETAPGNMPVTVDVWPTAVGIEHELGTRIGVAEAADLHIFRRFQRTLMPALWFTA